MQPLNNEELYLFGKVILQMFPSVPEFICGFKYGILLASSQNFSVASEII